MNKIEQMNCHVRFKQVQMITRDLFYHWTVLQVEVFQL